MRSSARPISPKLTGSCWERSQLPTPQVHSATRTRLRRKNSIASSRYREISSMKICRPAVSVRKVLLSACILAPTVVCAVAEPANLVVRHANVITVDINQPRAESFAVMAGKFVAVGGDEKIAPLIGPHTKVLDLKGKTVVPGFIDAHLHPRAIYPADSKWAR